MEILKPLTSSDRTILSRTITKVGTHALRSDLDLGTARIEDMGIDKYRWLSVQLAENTTRLLSGNVLEQLYPKSPEKHASSVNRLMKKKNGLRTGYRITGAVLAMTMEAYKKWKPVEDRSVEELVAMQKNPETINRNVIMLAKKPNEINKCFEESLSLTDGSTELAIKHGDIPFRIVENVETGNYFLPEIIRVIQQHGIEIVAAPEIPDEQCPAQQFIPLLWTRMIDICAEDSRFYQTDLGIVS